MSDVVKLLRDLTAGREARFRYAAAHDKFSELEQRHSVTNPIEAAGAHEYALIALRAYRAELDDQSTPPHHCDECPRPPEIDDSRMKWLLGDGNEPRDGMWR